MPANVIGSAGSTPYSSGLHQAGCGERQRRADGDAGSCEQQRARDDSVLNACHRFVDSPGAIQMPIWNALTHRV
jgi:hypothetical protein